MSGPVEILLIEDSEVDARLVEDRLRADGVDVLLERVWDRERFVAALDACTSHIIIADYQLPAFDGLTALAMARERCPAVPVIVYSGVLGEDSAVRALKAGATDYVVKDRIERLAPAVRRALAEADEQRRRLRAERELASAVALLRRSQQIANVGSWELDHAAGRLIWSEEAYRVLALHRDSADATFEAFVLALHPADRERVSTAFEESARAGRGGYQLEVRVGPQCPGARVVLHRCEHERDAGGRLLRSIGIVQDVTSQKQAEESLRRHAAELEARNAELDRFNRVAVGRELRMIELKREVNALCRALGEAERYRIDPPGT